MRKQTSELFYSFDEAIKGPILRMSAWFPSLLASFLTGGALYGFLYALLSVCFDVSEVVRFYGNGRSISVAAPNNPPVTRTALLRSVLASLFIFSVCLALGGHAFAQSVRPRISTEVNTQERATIPGTHPPMARTEQDTGRAHSDKQLQGLSVVLNRTAEQEADLQALITAQQDTASSLYHQWLSPEQFAERFGVADSDIEKIESWLQQQGFTVTGVSRSKTRIKFSGTVGQAETAFGTQIHYYQSGTVRDYAPSTDISIPRAFSSVIQTVSDLSTFRPKPHVKFKKGQRDSSVSPNFTSGQSGNHYLSPADIATIYDINPAYSAGYTGSGQAIAVVGQSAIQVSDIENFQKAAGFDVKDPTLVLVPNSGSSTYYTGGDEAESDLDLEYTSTIAKGATIYFVYTGNNQNYGVFDSLEYAIDTKLAPIISVSYGACETAIGSTDYATLNAVLAQAAAQGQTVVAASGDSGSTDCYEQTTLTTSQRQALAVDFPASSQYVTGLGGTEFSSSDVSSSNTTYWESGNSSDVVSSAKSYIPEQTWNDDSSSNGLSSGGGGVSILTSRPSWQIGVAGIPSGSYRLVPDISLDSSPANAGYLFCSSDNDATGVSGSCSNGFRDSNNSYLTVAGGTSFASPIFAGMLALINQKLNSSGQGVVNSTLYELASNSSTYTSSFHDITSGNNACTAGSSYCSGSATSQYSAANGYDQATGLGSVNLYNLLSVWPVPSNTSSKATSKTVLTAATTTPTSGESDLVTITVSSNSGAVSSVPTGTLSVAVDGTTVSSSLALSNGSASYTFSSTVSGTHVVTVTYSGDSIYGSSTGTITLTIGSTGGTTSGNGGSGSTTVTVTPSGGFTGTVDLSLSTTSTYLQQYACYDLSNANVTGTGSVSQTLTVYLGTSYCESAQLKGKIHTFRSAAQGTAPSPATTPGFPGGMVSLAGAFVMGFLTLRGRRMRLFPAVLLAAFAGAALVSCGSSGGSSSKSFAVSVSPSTMTISAGSSAVPTGSYTMTLTGTSSALSSSTNLNLTVN
ncbi:protease pro-enzyme activation domain-containing protein [Terriglobus saanensis]|uniref:Peptidase S53 propeptide n=1 Tax=Terriglobus saanensis (strain ATCC BAA-1853 / DSM 23119 / SP1PR4) TaxID=401053 RepID=E8V1W4_TERSS|nr:protease pro-enzyme activation domain-containing protein [Terriglobus saanensis]ADV83452.1 Peptidase S53 propeptide [Terriglobus saanensis SP1PR4]